MTYEAILKKEPLLRQLLDFQVKDQWLHVHDLEDFLNLPKYDLFAAVHRCTKAVLSIIGVHTILLEHVLHVIICGTGNAEKPPHRNVSRVAGCAAPQRGCVDANQFCALSPTLQNCVSLPTKEVRALPSQIAMLGKALDKLDVGEVNHDLSSSCLTPHNAELVSTHAFTSTYPACAAMHCRFVNWSSTGSLAISRVSCGTTI